MKKFIFVSSLVLTLGCSMMYSAQAYAFELGLGVYTYYSWKDYSWADAENLEMEGGLTEGPVVNMTWAHTVSLTLSVVAPFFDKDHADFSFKDLVIDESDGEAYKVHVENASLDKSDIDIALSYAFSPRLKVFAGAKYINMEIFEGVDTVFTAVRQSDGNVVIQKTEYGMEEGDDNSYYSNKVYGGALGGNYAYPLFRSLYLVTNVSLLYFTGNITSTLVRSNFQSSSDTSFVGSYNSIGSNITLSLSNYFDLINTAFALGGRYQVVYNMYKSGDYDGSDKKFDRVWGITFSAMYFMNFFEEE